METTKITNFDLYDIVLNGDKKVIIRYIELEGCKTNRDNGSIGFVDFIDGTYFKSVTCHTSESKNYNVLSALKTGAAIKNSAN